MDSRQGEHRPQFAQGHSVYNFGPGIIKVLLFILENFVGLDTKLYGQPVYRPILVFLLDFVEIKYRIQSYKLCSSGAVTNVTNESTTTLNEKLGFISFCNSYCCTYLDLASK